MNISTSTEFKNDRAFFLDLFAYFHTTAVSDSTQLELACSAGGFRRDERVDIPIGCSGRHLELEKQWRIGAR